LSRELVGGYFRGITQKNSFGEHALVTCTGHQHMISLIITEIRFTAIGVCRLTPRG